MEKEQMTVTELIDEWIGKYCANLAESTRYAYGVYNRAYIIPVIGNKTVSEVIQKDIQEVINRIAEKGLSQKTQKNAIGQMHKIFQYAVINEYKAYNPVQQIVKKKTPPYEYVIYSTEEFRRLLAVCDRQSDKAIIALVGFSGLRISEALGLKWENVDLKKRSIHIYHVAVTVGNEIDLKDIPKTASGNRRIEIPEEAVHELKLWQEQCCRYAGYVFPSRGNAELPDRSGYFRDRCSRYMKLANLQHSRVHDLRHYAATEFMDGGVPDKYIAAYLGHSDTNMTKKYQHIRAKTIPFPCQTTGQKKDK